MPGEAKRSTCHQLWSQRHFCYAERCWWAWPSPRGGTESGLPGANLEGLKSPARELKCDWGKKSGLGGSCSLFPCKVGTAITRLMGSQIHPAVRHQWQQLNPCTFTGKTKSGRQIFPNCPRSFVREACLLVRQQLELRSIDYSCKILTQYQKKFLQV